MKMTQEICDKLTAEMVSRGWTCDVNNEQKLGFIFKEDEEHEWIRDYNKETGSFVHYNGKQKINLVSTKK